ncbi:hypothetical protein [Demequina sp.]|uniref:hypothetical protein n=1 Tax=Demequina sp. TaxID=2050685 RepID=UPI003D11ED97
MPRLTDQTYLSNYDALRDEYLRGGRSFALLEPQEQWALFDFYLHHERHGREELLIYRQEITALNPSLPQQAGKAFRRWQQVRETAIAKRQQAGPVKRRNSTDFTLGFQVRAEPDVRLLARAVVQLATYLVEQEKARAAAESEPPAHVDDSQSSGR